MTRVKTLILSDLIEKQFNFYFLINKTHNIEFIRINKNETEKKTSRFSCFCSVIGFKTGLIFPVSTYAPKCKFSIEYY